MRRSIVTERWKARARLCADPRERDVASRAVAILEEYERTRRDWRRIQCDLPGGKTLEVARLCPLPGKSRRTAGELYD